MSIMEALQRERAEQERLTQIGMERAKLSAYGFIAVSERRYAVIERTSRSVDLRQEGEPVGVNRYTYVEGCSRLTHQEAQSELTRLLRQEVEVRPAMKILATKKGSITLDKSHTDHVEHDIRPPMRTAITIPVDGMPGAIIYVCSSPFTGEKVTKSELQMIAEALELNL